MCWLFLGRSDPLTVYTRLLTFNQVKFERAAESQIDLCWCLKTSYWERFFRFYLYFFLAQFSPLTLSFVFSKGSNWFQLNVLYKSTLSERFSFSKNQTKSHYIVLIWQTYYARIFSQYFKWHFKPWVSVLCSKKHCVSAVVAKNMDWNLLPITTWNTFSKDNLIDNSKQTTL